MSAKRGKAKVARNEVTLVLYRLGERAYETRCKLVRKTPAVVELRRDNGGSVLIGAASPLERVDQYLDQGHPADVLVTTLPYGGILPSGRTAERGCLLLPRKDLMLVVLN